MSLAWMGRRAVRYLIASSALVAACVVRDRQAATAARRLRAGGGRRPGQPDGARRSPATCASAACSRAARGMWDDPEGAPYDVEFQWVRDNQDLTGETAATHTITPADVGHGLRCDVRATGDYGSTEAGSPTFYPPARRATPPRSAATCASAARSPAPAAPGTTTASPPTRRPRVAAQRRPDRRPDRLHLHGHAATTSAARCSAASASARSPARPPPASTPPRRDPRDPRDQRRPAARRHAQLLRGTWDDEGLTPYATTKQWLRDSAEILGATGDDYTVRLADIGHRISCRVRAADLTDSTSSTVYPTSPAQRSQPGIEGDPRLGRTLTCKRGTWDDAGRTGDYGVNYEWFRNNVFIAGGRDLHRSPRSTSTSRCAARSPSRA